MQSDKKSHPSAEKISHDGRVHTRIYSIPIFVDSSSSTNINGNTDTTDCYPYATDLDKGTRSDGVINQNFDASLSTASYSSIPIPLPSSNWSKEKPSSEQVKESSSRRSISNIQQNPYNSSCELDSNLKVESSHNGTNSSQTVQKSLCPNSHMAIEIIRSQVDLLIGEIDTFNGNSSKDKHYRYLDEMLTRYMIDLDNIDCGENDAIRQYRKSVIKTINQAIVLLETKLEYNLTKSDDSQSLQHIKQQKSFRVTRILSRLNPFRKHSK